MASKILVVSDPPTALVGKSLVETIIDPEISRFEEWFQQPNHGRSSLTGMEKELLRSYLYQKLRGVV